MDNGLPSLLIQLGDDNDVVHVTGRARYLTQMAELGLVDNADDHCGRGVKPEGVQEERCKSDLKGRSDVRRGGNKNIEIIENQNGSGVLLTDLEQVLG